MKDDIHITIYTKRPCDDCAFLDGEGYDCCLPEMSGFDDGCQYNREYVDNDDGDAYMSCKCCMDWDDIIKIVTWFLNNHSDKITYDFSY